jgi:ubiquitin-protein ligase
VIDVSAGPQNSPRPHWDRRFPGRFQWELKAFKDANVQPVVEPNALAQGILIVDFEWPYEGRTLPLRAIYPDGYPYLRPHVTLQDPSLFPSRHISPNDGSLCLIGRDSRQWTSGLNVPQLLRDQLSEALKGGANEDPQGEPVEFWWNGLATGSSSYCLIETSRDLMSIGGVISGWLTIRYTLDDENSQNPLLRAAVTRVASHDGAVLAEWNRNLPPHLIGDAAREIKVPWERLSTAPLPDHISQNHSGLIKLLRSKVATSSPLFQTSKLSKRRFRLNAFLYPSELTWKQEGDGWLFTLAFGGAKAFNGHGNISPRVIRTLRAGISDLASRVPRAAALSSKTVCLVGVGALGAPLAIEFARNGIRELRLLDFDIVEPGNSIRWPLGASVWGQPKVEALGNFLRSEYPNTAIKTVSHCLGTVSDKPPFGDERALEELLDGVDLVVDASAAYWTTALLQDYAVRRNLHLLSLYASPPVTGGIVALYGSEAGCPACLEQAAESGLIPRPPGMDDEGALVQPAGCSERTFTGASYDLQELSLHAMRVAVGFLTESIGRDTSTIYTLAFQESGGVKIPSWRVDQLRPHAECTCRM